MNIVNMYIVMYIMYGTIFLLSLQRSEINLFIVSVSYFVYFLNIPSQ